MSANLPKRSGVYRNSLFFSSSNFLCKKFPGKIIFVQSACSQYLSRKFTSYNYICENNSHVFSSHENTFATKKANEHVETNLKSLSNLLFFLLDLVLHGRLLKPRTDRDGTLHIFPVITVMEYRVGVVVSRQLQPPVAAAPLLSLS